MSFSGLSDIASITTKIQDAIAKIQRVPDVLVEGKRVIEDQVKGQLTKQQDQVKQLIDTKVQEAVSKITPTGTVPESNVPMGPNAYSNTDSEPVDPETIPEEELPPEEGGEYVNNEYFGGGGRRHASSKRTRRSRRKLNRKARKNHSQRTMKGGRRTRKAGKGRRRGSRKH